MRNAIAILAAFCILHTLTGCSSQTNTPPAPVPPPAPTVIKVQTPSAWTLKLASTCKSSAETPTPPQAFDEVTEPSANDATEPTNVTDPTQCVGLYGFSVANDGTFQIGPGPEGESRKGQLTQDELDNLNNIMKPLMKSSALNTTQNHDTVDAGANDSTITVTFDQGSPQALLTTTGTNLTFQTQAASDAKAIFTAISNLAKKYYALPFPDSCNDEAVLLQAQLDSLNTCAQDSDCAYVDDQLNVIEANSTSSLTTDNCSLIHPIIVGNAKTIQFSASKIQEKLNNVTTACGERMTRPDCTQQSTMQLTGMAPVCQEGKCQPKTASSTIYHILK